jgi:hypothetical protein
MENGKILMLFSMQIALIFHVVFIYVPAHRHFPSAYTIGAAQKKKVKNMLNAGFCFCI